jgi:hypothetical protein
LTGVTGTEAGQSDDESQGEDECEDGGCKLGAIRRPMVG